MVNETEKLTINLGVVELAQIDVLVEQGVYANRSDFIRTSIRTSLDNHKSRIEASLIPIASKREWEKFIGICHISGKTLEKLRENDSKLNISVIGMLIFESSINTTLFSDTVENVVLRGKLIASDDIKNIIAQMNG